jgi:predicted  nucleic acid-binding Zn-ribbon protein
MAQGLSEEGSKILYWIMTALLGICMAALGFYLKELHTRIDQYAVREAQRYESLTSTNATRGERLATYEVKLATIEPRLTALEGKFGALEPRVPLMESRITQANDRLQRIEEKLDRLLSAKGGTR